MTRKFVNKLANIALVLYIFIGLDCTMGTEEIIKPVPKVNREKIYKEVVREKTQEFIEKEVCRYSPNNKDYQNKIIASTIINESEKYKIEPEKLLSVALSESGCDVNAKHSLNYVVGICGINTKVWTKELIENDIIEKKEDLKWAKYSIKAMAYILNKKMEESNKNFKVAVHKYKGNVKATNYQVKNTLDIYNRIKNKVKEA